jgi:hypothetical protein
MIDEVEAYPTQELVENLTSLVEFIQRAEYQLSLDPDRVKVGTSLTEAALADARYNYDRMMAELKRREGCQEPK